MSTALPAAATLTGTTLVVPGLPLAAGQRVTLLYVNDAGEEVPLSTWHADPDLDKLLTPGYGLEKVNGQLGLVQPAVNKALPPALGVGAIDYNTGQVDTQYFPKMVYSDFLPMQAGVTLTMTPFNPQYGAFYDANRAFISDVNTYLAFNNNLTPPGTAYWRVSFDGPSQKFTGVKYTALRYTVGQLPYVRSVNGNTPDGNGDVVLTAFDSVLPLTATRTVGYTLDLPDAGHLVPVSSASAVTIIVPDNASAPFPVGTTLYVAQDGTGAVTIAAASGVLVQTAQGYKVGGQWQDVALHKRDLNTWVLKGGVA